MGEPILSPQGVVDGAASGVDVEAWFEDDGRTLVRSGSGRVIAIVEHPPSVVVEIEVEAAPRQAKAVRLVVAGSTRDDALIHTAGVAQLAEAPVEWMIRWVPLDWVPTDLPFTRLTIATDTEAQLVHLSVREGVVANVDHTLRALLSGSGDG